MDDNKQVIFILDDDIGVTRLLKETINKKIPEVFVYCFQTCDKMMVHPVIDEVGLFIIDIELDSNLKGNQVANELFKNELNVPYLFMSGSDYEYECFSEYGYTYDFIKKPCDTDKLINRILVLLKVGIAYKKHEIEKRKLQINLKELFNYTNIYMLILNSDMTIKMCSYKLAKDLGYTSEESLIGENWSQFLKEKDQTKIKIVHDNVVDNTEKYQKFLREVTNKIVTKTGTTIAIKWFNSRIKNGDVFSFSIGIPYNRKVSPDDNIDSIRAYWKHVLDKDETTLKALKNVG